MGYEDVSMSLHHPGGSGLHHAFPLHFCHGDVCMILEPVLTCYVNSTTLYFFKFFKLWGNFFVEMLKIKKLEKNAYKGNHTGCNFWGSAFPTQHNSMETRPGV